MKSFQRQHFCTDIHHSHIEVGRGRLKAHLWKLSQQDKTTCSMLSMSQNLILGRFSKVFRAVQENVFVLTIT